MLDSRSVLKDNSIAYAFGIGQIPGAISTPGALVVSDSRISTPSVPSVATPKTAVAMAQQNQNINADVAQVPADTEKAKAISGLFGTAVVLGIIWLFLK